MSSPSLDLEIMTRIGWAPLLKSHPTGPKGTRLCQRAKITGDLRAHNGSAASLFTQRQRMVAWQTRKYAAISHATAQIVKDGLVSADIFGADDTGGVIPYAGAALRRPLRPL